MMHAAAAVGAGVTYRAGQGQSSSDLVDGLMIALMRCLCAFSAVIIFQFDPLPAERLGEVSTAATMAYLALFIYCLYCVANSIVVYRGGRLVPRRAEPWIDVVFYSFLIVLTGGTASIFYHYYFFAILVAAFTRGSIEGLAVTGTCVAIYIIIGFAGGHPWLRLELHQALIRTLYLFLLGYMLSQWGGQEIALRRRLQFLRTLSEIVRPKLAAERVVLENLREFADFFDARACILILERDGAKSPLLYRVERKGQMYDLQVDEVSRETATALLDVQSTTSACVQTQRLGTLAERRRVRVFTYAGRRIKCDPAAAQKWLAIATLLEARHLAAVPYIQPDGTTGRLYLVAQRRLSDADTAFLGQAVVQIASAVNNIMLQEELARSAAQQERSSISRDIHDTTIQSYIGLKLGLEAMYRSIGPQVPLAGRIKELLDMATLTVEDLRGYVNRLQGRTGAQPATSLAARLDEQVRRYRDFHGFDVELNCAALTGLNEQVSADANGLVSEALSNVFRHTAAKRAFVDVRCAGGSLAIEVANDSTGGEGRDFVPRSISERAATLGGKVQVRLDTEGRDVVKVTIPLPQAAPGAASPV